MFLPCTSSRVCDKGRRDAKGSPRLGKKMQYNFSPPGPGLSLLEPSHQACSEGASGRVEKPRVGVQPTAFTKVTANAGVNRQMCEGVKL